MTDAKRKMHLAIQAAAPGHPAGWRVPGGERQANEDVAHYQNVARICERALLDVLFLADSPSFTDDGRSPTRSLDPAEDPDLVPRLAGVGDDYELVFTSPTDANPAIECPSPELALPITATDAIERKAGVRLVDAARKRVPISASGWQHF